MNGDFDSVIVDFDSVILVSDMEINVIFNVIVIVNLDFDFLFIVNVV